MKYLANPLFLRANYLLLVAVLFAGCAAPTAVITPAPTIDQATYVAQAVETLSARMTEDAQRNPSPTATPDPTSTPEPPTATPLPPTFTPTPEMTATPSATQPAALSAQFLYAATYPENKRVYVPNEKFGLALGFQNNGTLTWLPGYSLKIVNFEGEITVQQDAQISRQVAPGEKYEVNLWAFGSETLGRHVWYFQLFSDAGIAVPGGLGVFTYESE